MDDRPKADDASFEARLNAARTRQGLDPSPPDPDRNGGIEGSPWGLGMRVGVEMVSALVVAVAIGWGLDRWLRTTPIFIAVFVILGGAAGVLNVWRLFEPRAGDKV
jgi:ATP synthase protein I